MALNYDILIAHIDGLYADGTLSTQDYTELVNFILSNGSLETKPRDLIQFRRGNLASLPSLTQAEAAFTLDEEDLYIGGLLGNVHFINKKKTLELANAFTTINIESYSHLVEGIGTITEDWSNAITQALSDLPVGGGEIFFPRNRYVFSQKISIPNISVAQYVRFRGLHSWGTILVYNGSDSPFIDAKGAIGSTDRVYFEMRDIGISYEGSTPLINGIELMYNTPSSNFYNLYVNGFTGIGIATWDNWNITFINVRSTNNGTDGFKRVGGAVNNLRFIGGEFSGNGATGMTLTGLNHLIDGSSFEANGTYCLHLLYCSGITLNSPYFENDIASTLLYMVACNGVSINGVNFSLFNEGETLVKAIACEFIVNGMHCSISGSTSTVNAIGLDISDCYGVMLNSLSLNNIATGVKLTNSRGEINYPEFLYVTTPVLATDHEFVLFDIKMKTSYFDLSNLGVVATYFIRKTYIDKRHYGTTAERPTGINDGYQYYDIVLDKPIWWNGTNWKDASGTTV